MRIVEVERGRLLEPCSLDLFNYQIDPYAGCAHHCVYCYTQNDPPLDWDSEVGTLAGLRVRLAGELDSIRPQTIYMGMNTDPYQPVEEELRQTRTVLEHLACRGFAVCVLTKSDLVLRDMDLIRSMPGSTVGFSVAFAHENVRRLFEKGSGSTQSRTNALERLKRNRIETYVLIDPVIPYITEVGPLIESVAPHVETIWIYSLHMDSRDDPNWRATRGVLEQHFPEALADIERATFDSRDAYWRNLRRELLDMGFGLAPRLELHI